MPKVPVPFLIADEAWQNLKPKPIDVLARRRDLTPEEEERLGIFRQMDLRVEWACSRLVIVNNVVVILAFTVIAILLGTAFGQRAIEILKNIWPSP